MAIKRPYCGTCRRKMAPEECCPEVDRAGLLQECEGCWEAGQYWPADGGTDPAALEDYYCETGE